MQALLNALGIFGGISGIVDTVKSIAIGLFDRLKEVMQIVVEYLVKLIRWWMSLLVNKPEAGVTLTLIFLYLLSPY